MDFSIIIPVYNEEGNIDLLYDRLDGVIKGLRNEQDIPIAYEMIFINDGSADNSLQMIKELSKRVREVHYINFSRNFGHQIAVSAGIDKASGKAVAIIDADLQDPPELLIQMYEKFKSGYEVVYAKRKKRKGESKFKLFTAKLFYRIIKSITSIEIPVDVGDFRIIDKKIVNVLRKMPEKNKFLRGQISWAGFNQTYVEYDRQERHEGETGYPFSKMLKFALDGITAFSDFPLKIATFLGFTSALISLLFIIYALVSKFILQEVIQGWTSIMISVMFIGGVQLICLGIIGEYIVRLINNVKDRPLYITESSSFDDQP